MSSEGTTVADGYATCQWCGLIHQAGCPKVKAIEYEHGMLKRVEFFAPNDYGPKMSAWPAAIPPGQYGPAYALAPNIDYTSDPRFTAAAPAPYFGAWHNQILAGIGADKGSGGH